MFETEEGRRMASACIEYGGWDHKNQTLTPIKLAELLARKMRAFRHVLREAGGDRWLTDRHHNALRKLGNAEFDVTTYVGFTALFDPAENSR
jgi:siroheme synthase